MTKEQEEGGNLICQYMGYNNTWAHKLQYHRDIQSMWPVLQKLLPELRATQREGELESHIVVIEMALLELDIEKVFLATTEAIQSLNAIKIEEVQDGE